MKDKLKYYKPVAEAISMLLFPHAEVVLHDLKKGCIGAIFNSYSKRRIGDESLLEFPGFEVCDRYFVMNPRTFKDFLMQKS